MFPFDDVIMEMFILLKMVYSQYDVGPVEYTLKWLQMEYVWKVKKRILNRTYISKFT